MQQVWYENDGELLNQRSHPLNRTTKRINYDLNSKASIQRSIPFILSTAPPTLISQIVDKALGQTRKITPPPSSSLVRHPPHPSKHHTPPPRIRPQRSRHGRNLLAHCRSRLLRSSSARVSSDPSAAVAALCGRRPHLGHGRVASREARFEQILHWGFVCSATGRGR
jgi:hypothetical protein